MVRHILRRELAPWDDDDDKKKRQLIISDHKKTIQHCARDRP